MPITSLGINPLINGSIIIEASLTFWEKILIIPLETFCGNQMKWLIEYEKSNSDLWTGLYIAVGFKRKLLIMYLYVLCTIHVYLILHINYPD